MSDDESIQLSEEDRKFFESGAILSQKISERVEVRNDASGWVVSFGPGMTIPCYTEDAADCVADDLRGILRSFAVDLVTTLQGRNLL